VNVGATKSSMGSVESKNGNWIVGGVGRNGIFTVGVTGITTVGASGITGSTVTGAMGVLGNAEDGAVGKLSAGACLHEVQHFYRNDRAEIKRRRDGCQCCD